MEREWYFAQNIVPGFDQIEAERKSLSVLAEAKAKGHVPESAQFYRSQRMAVGVFGDCLVFFAK